MTNQPEPPLDRPVPVEEITPGMAAIADQNWAGGNSLLDHLVTEAANHVAAHGPVVAHHPGYCLGNNVAHHLTRMKLHELGTLVLVAIARLAEQQL